jgi:tRNA pseudouridine55 synthase
VLLVDKPFGPTSFDVVQRVRRAAGAKKAGHTGTLDPAASGLLVVCLEDATRIATFLVDGTKSYRGTVRLGATTDTLDAAGAVLETRDASHVTRADVERELAAMHGVQTQVAPMYSAKRVDGQRLYDLAREGKEVEQPTFEVTIEEARLETFDPPDAVVHVRCSKGTYIRTIAATLGERLGCGAHLAALRRLSSGRFSVDDTLTLAEVEARGKAGTLADAVLSVERALEELPALRLDERHAASVAFGNALTPDVHHRLSLPMLATGLRARLLDPAGQVVAVGESDGAGTVKLLRVLRPRTGPGLHKRE